MANEKAILRAARATVCRGLVLQIIVVIVASLILLLFHGIYSAALVLLGGAVYILPHCLFACLVFSYYKASAPTRMIRNFYRGELMKLLLTGALFVIVIIWLPIKLLPFMVGFVSALVITWLMPLLSIKSKL